MSINSPCTRYFLKVHYGVGWCGILKNLLQSKVLVLGARNEWRAIQRLQTLGVETMNLVGYGERGMNPARRQSFVITDALENMIILADFCAGWAANPPRSGAALALKRTLIRRAAEISGRLHRPETKQHSVNESEIMCAFSRAINCQKLQFHEKAVSDNGFRTTRSHEFARVVSRWIRSAIRSFMEKQNRADRYQTQVLLRDCFQMRCYNSPWTSPYHCTVALIPMLV